MTKTELIKTALVAGLAYIAVDLIGTFVRAFLKRLLTRFRRSARLDS